MLINQKAVKAVAHACGRRISAAYLQELDIQLRAVILAHIGLRNGKFKTLGRYYLECFPLTLKMRFPDRKKRNKKKGG